MSEDAVFTAQNIMGCFTLAGVSERRRSGDVLASTRSAGVSEG